MKKIFNFVIAAVCGMAIVACSNANVEQSGKEAELQKVVKPYVENTVIATYSAMASEGIVLLEKVEAIQEAVKNKEDYSNLIVEAGKSWREMRHHWEQSEAFLYGPADKHYIDPHIDSWPLDYNTMNTYLASEEIMKKVEEEGGDFVRATFSYALLGFHAAEYFLFEEGNPHKTNLTYAQAVYLTAIVEDLAQQAILLEDCWAGGVSEEKEAIIYDEEEDESMSWGENYGEYFMELSHPDWKTYQAVVEQIVSGCVDIAGEVADLKMGKPYRSSSKADQEYIESPYSYTSTTDFADNIISIKNAYCGAKAGDACVADYVKKYDSELNDKVVAAIDESIKLIGEIKDFETKAKDNADVKAAIDQVSELAELLEDEVLPLIGK
ncbi:MAG: hypothetical protein IJ776_05145 [Paludibacteraceae bacterium]|nr:hypothetical protein [Paludibacteraceae bacterium]